MDIKLRDARLENFFNKEVLSQLEDAELNALSEEFSNTELKVLAGQGLETIKVQLSRHMQAEYERRLKHIQPEEYEVLKPWYKEISKTLDEIICSKCGVLLGLEIDTIDDSRNPYHHEGKFVVPIGEALMSYRPRLDGLMGYQCGNKTDSKYKKDWDKFFPELEAYQKENSAKIKELEEATAEWENLPEKKRGKTKAPEVKFDPAPIEPEGLPYDLCDNDTRWAQIEIDNIPENHVMTSVTKEDRIKVKQEMDATNYVPDTTETKRGKKVETFELRKVQ